MQLARSCLGYLPNLLVRRWEILCACSIRASAGPTTVGAVLIECCLLEK